MSGEMLMRFVECRSCGVIIVGEFDWIPHALFQVMAHKIGNNCLVKAQSVSDQQGALLKFTGERLKISTGEIEQFAKDNGWMIQQDSVKGSLYYLVNG